MNRIRREHPALQLGTNLTFHAAQHPTVLWYAKATPGDDDVVFVAVSLDTTQVQDALVEVPVAALGIGADEPYVMHELLSDTVWEWRGGQGYVKLDPDGDPAQIFHLRRTARPR